MLVVEIRKATEEDAGLLHSLLKRSKGAELSLSSQILRRELSSSYEIAVTPEATTKYDPSFEFDINLVQPNCSVCQAHLAWANGNYLGHLIFHYFYTPWKGRVVFVDDVFVEDTYNETEVADKLLETLKDFCDRENLDKIVFNSDDVSRELMSTVGGFECDVYRNDDTDWSVNRVEFNEPEDDQKLSPSSGQSAECR